jgi:diacylglycerol kinase family enzyme
MSAAEPSPDRYVIVFRSPKAGSGAARELVPRLMDRLRSGGIEHQLVDSTVELSRIVEQRRETGRPQPIVVAAGGDGTISLVASLTSQETPLLPMPLGTENLVARFLGQSNAPEAVMATLRGGRTLQVDAGSANGRIFLIMATVGFDAEVVRRVHLRRTGHIRRNSYFKPILQTLLRYRFPKLTVSTLGLHGEIVDHRTARWAMVFNLPCYAAGLEIVPSADGQDGKLDVITFARGGILSGLRYVAGVMLRAHRRFSDVQQRQVACLRIESQRPVAYELDGDYVGRTPIDIQVLPRRVRLLVPPQANVAGV